MEVDTHYLYNTNNFFRLWEQEMDKRKVSLRMEIRVLRCVKKGFLNFWKFLNFPGKSSFMKVSTKIPSY